MVASFSDEVDQNDFRGIPDDGWFTLRECEDNIVDYSLFSSLIDVMDKGGIAYTFCLLGVVHPVQFRCEITSNSCCTRNEICASLLSSCT